MKHLNITIGMDYDRLSDAPECPSTAPRLVDEPREAIKRLNNIRHFVYTTLIDVYSAGIPTSAMEMSLAAYRRAHLIQVFQLQYAMRIDDDGSLLAEAVGAIAQGNDAFSAIAATGVFVDALFSPDGPMPGLMVCEHTLELSPEVTAQMGMIWSPIEDVYVAAFRALTRAIEAHGTVFLDGGLLEKDYDCTTPGVVDDLLASLPQLNDIERSEAQRVAVAILMGTAMRIQSIHGGKLYGAADQDPTAPWLPHRSFDTPHAHEIAISAWQTPDQMAIHPPNVQPNEDDDNETIYLMPANTEEN